MTVPLRLAGGLRVGVGAALLVRPSLGSARRDASRQARSEAVASRLLGARLLLQAALTARRPTRRVVLIGAAVDGAHGLSMAALALRAPSHRRLAAVNGMIAGVFVALGLGDLSAP